MAVDDERRWYWCFQHSDVEGEPGCPAKDRMGPYASPEEAQNWRERVQARNEAWEAEEE